MPQPRKYQDAAARQAAYRERVRAGITPPAAPGALGYARWRKAVREAYALLDTVYEELDGWMKDRSERWQESDRAGELEADKDALYEILDKLDELGVLTRQLP